MKDVFKPMLVELEIKIKAYDIDVMGIVSNIVYVRWFEDLRTLFLIHFYPLRKS
jgi:acyl-CoA thioester hydrolase